MQALYDFDIHGSIVESTVKLFDSMLSMKTEFVETSEKPVFDGPRITGTLSFAGKLLGVIHIHVDFMFAYVIAGSMLGMDPGEFDGDEEVNDVLLEMCNIIGGNLKSKFNDAGMQCIITTPSITSGKSFDIDSLNMTRHELFKFRCQENFFYIEIFLKPEDEATAESLKKITSIDVSNFNRLDIISSTGDKVIELFDKMLSMDIELADSGKSFEEGLLRYNGSVEFAGDVNGNVSIQVNQDFSKVMVANLLGIKPEEVDDEEDIKDMIGELSNIIAGNLRTAFCDTGLNCEMSPPTVTTGVDFKITTMNMDKSERFAFEYYGQIIFVDVCVKFDKSAIIVEESEKTEAAPPAAEAPADTHDKETEAIPEHDEVKKQVKDEKVKSSEIANWQDNLDVVFDIPLQITVELGKTSLKIKELLKIGQEDTISFSNLEGELLDLLINNKVVAKGEVVIEKEKYGIKITKILNRMDRIRNLR
ncbi:MAG: hypothetical protein DRI73_04675 [Bacteroidetes bacterium]|nr:MAG: hypothetical protein DRI73_04675 [Bacteroidota bacterium]